MEPTSPSLRGAADAARAGIADLRNLAEGLEGPDRESASRLAEQLEQAAEVVESALEASEPSEASQPASERDASSGSVSAPSTDKASAGTDSSPRKRRRRRKRRHAKPAESESPAPEASEDDDWATVELGCSEELDPRTLTGHTSSFGVAEILGFLSSLRKSGTLHVHGALEHFQIELRLGEVVYASGDSPPPELRLGQILVAQGSLEQSELDALLAAGRGRMLGRSLLESGRLTEDAMRIALAFQAQNVFHRLYSTHDARFEFRENEHLDKLDDIQLNVTHLLLESARNLDEQVRKVDEELSWLDG